MTNGCAGDMIVASLIDAGLDLKNLERELEKLPLKNYKLEVKRVKRKTDFSHQIEATQFIVKPEGKWNDKTPYKEILKILRESSFSSEIKKKIIKIFDTLANAEATIHKEEKENVHFHQIGQVDAIVEIVSAVIGLEILGIDRVYSSPVGVSNLAPATCEILKGVPLILKNYPFEITTPTGASILKTICDFSPLNNDFYLNKIGYGAGTREEPSPNVVKFLMGEIKTEKEEVLIVETNIDDMNPVLAGNLIEKLLKNGALDVSLFQGIGKKGRPVFKIEAIIPDYKLKEICEVIFKESTTIGLRYRKEKRIVLKREIKEIDTELGKIKIKISYYNGEKVNITPEFEDCKRISEEKNIPLKKVYQIINKSLEI